MLTVVPVTI